MAQDTPRITTGTRWAYGGGAGYGVLNNAHFFVLIYYSQVLGKSPHQQTEWRRNQSVANSSLGANP